MKLSKKYVVISPVRDEERYVEQTILSLISQTTKPERWIIVDDGSQDSTVDIIHKYEKQYSWIQLIRLERNTTRQPGGAVITAFNEGYKLVEDEDFDFIVKLDCDLRFDPDYFEKLFSKLQPDMKIGIVSGIYLEQSDDHWIPIDMPPYHAAGASKIVRNECFRQIGGFIPARGWDTVDEIRAQTMGWKTCHFKDVIFYHLKTEGAGIGQVRTNIMHGEIFYLTGGSKLFFAFKVLHRMFFGKPFLVGGMMMIWGYWLAFVSKRNLLVTEQEALFYKRLLNKRLKRRFNFTNH